MINDACAHAMPKPNACLTPRVLHPFPLKEILSRDLCYQPSLVETRIDLTKIIILLPRSVLLTMVIPYHLVEFNDFAMSHSFHFFKHSNRSFFIGQIRLDLDTSEFNSFFGHTKTFLELGDMENIEYSSHFRR